MVESENMQSKSGAIPAEYERRVKQMFAQQNSMTQQKQEAAPQSKCAYSRKKSRPKRFLDAIITASITALFFGAPLFFTSLTMQDIAFDKQIYFYFWLLVALVAWAIKSATSGKLVIRRTPLDYPLIGTFLAILVSAYLSDDRWHSFWGAFGDPSQGVIAFIAGVFAFYLVITHFSWERFRWFFGAFVLSGSVVVVWTFLGLLGVHFLPASFAAIAPLSLIGSLKGLTLFFSLMIPLFISTLFGLWREEVRMKPLLRYAMSAILVIVIALSLINIFSLLSYTPLMALTIGAIFFLIFILARIIRPYGALSFMPIAFLVAVIGFIVVYSPNSPVRSPFVSEEITLPPEVTLSVSFSWQIAKASLKEHFFFGYGPAMYGQAFSMARPEELNTQPLYALRFLRGEGVLFDSLSTIGIVGTIFLILTVLTFVSVSIYLMVRDQKYNKIYSLGLVSAFITLCVAALFNRVEGSMILVGTLLSTLTLAVLYSESKVSFSTVSFSLKASPKFALSFAFISIVLIAGIGMSFFFVGKIFVADALAGKAVHAQEVSVETIAYLTRAAQLNQHEGHYLIRAGQEYMVLANREALKDEKDRNLQTLRSYLEMAQDITAKGRDLLPVSVAAAEIYAQILESASRYYDATMLSTTGILDDVDKAYEYAQRLEPSNAIYPLKRGEVALRKALLIDPKKENERKEMLVKAKEFFSTAINKKPNLAPAYYQRALIEQSLDNIDDAIADMEKAFIASGNANITYAYNLGVLYKKRDKENDAARAEFLFRSILAVNNNDVNVHFEQATLYEQKNKIAAAIKEYEKVLELLPDDESAAATREKIEATIEKLKQSGVSVENDEHTGSKRPKVDLTTETKEGSQYSNKEEQSVGSATSADKQEEMQKSGKKDKKDKKDKK